MQTLSRQLVLSSAHQSRSDLILPAPDQFDLPEKIVQFGTGAFLRGFADFFVERANRSGLFGGRIVAVGSTGSGRTLKFNRQDGLYTLVSQGKKDGRVVDEATVVSAVSRALSAQDEWTAVLECAANPDLTTVISNTTEIGIVLDETDSRELDPPRSYPGKLTAFLFARANAFDFDPDASVIILPCELLENNGDRLGEIVKTLARRWEIGVRFYDWLEHCRFCNTLVDRIVTGMPEDGKRDALYERLGYNDRLLTCAEPYRLFAIEGREDLSERLPFLQVDEGIVVADDITPYRELKVRILNGAHTIMVPAALQAGLRTVREAVNDPSIGPFLRRVMEAEIVPSLRVDARTAESFARDVLDRFDNPFIDHPLRSIMLQATMKCRVRNVPSIRSYVQKFNRLPVALVKGLALLLLIRRNDDPADYPPDDLADLIRDAWQKIPSESIENLRGFVRGVLSDERLWQTDLSSIPGLESEITETLFASLQDGVRTHIERFVNTPDLQ